MSPGHLPGDVIGGGCFSQGCYSTTGHSNLPATFEIRIQSNGPVRQSISTFRSRSLVNFARQSRNREAVGTGNQSGSEGRRQPKSGKACVTLCSQPTSGINGTPSALLEFGKLRSYGSGLGTSYTLLPMFASGTLPSVTTILSGAMISMRLHPFGGAGGAHYFTGKQSRSLAKSTGPEYFFLISDRV